MHRTKHERQLRADRFTTPGQSGHRSSIKPSFTGRRADPSDNTFPGG